MTTVEDLMVTNLTTVTEHSSLAEAKTLMHNKNIRNLPVVNQEGECIGMLTQREYLRYAFYLVSQFGTQQLAKKEEQTPVSKVMNKDILTIDPSVSLETAAEFFIENKYGCLPIVKDSQLLGILTPVDFVKFAHKKLLEQNQ